MPVDDSDAPTARASMRWSDFQLVLAIHRAGGVARAWGPLGMTHSTLLRKLDRLEAHLQTLLFERARGRYALTRAGQEIVQVAEGFEPQALAAEQRALGQDPAPRGEVRVSVASVLLEHLLPPVIAQFASAFPHVQLELAGALEHASLRRREADVAIRVSDAVPQWLVGRELAMMRFRIYGRRRGRAVTPLSSLRELAGLRRWIGFERDARELKFDRWLAATIPAENIVLRVDNFNHALAMVRAGVGIALLPVIVEATAHDIAPLTPVIELLDTPLWLITHPDLRHTAPVQVMLRAFGPALAQAVKKIQREI